MMLPRNPRACWRPKSSVWNQTWPMSAYSEEGNIDTSKVSILTQVTVTNLVNKKQYTYHLVSEKEADLKQGKISVSSPIGKGLLGKQVGEVADVIVPAGKLQFIVESITIASNSAGAVTFSPVTTPISFSLRKGTITRAPLCGSCPSCTA